MKTEKPAPDGADFSGKSNGTRHPKATAPDISHQARKRALLASTRTDCIRIITRLVGEGGLQTFLKCRQPALGDRSGAQLLQHDPVELLHRLKWLDACNEDFDDDLVGDPGIEHYGRQRRESQANRVLEILDGIERSGT